MIELSVRDVVKHYGPEPVLGGASFELQRGERAALIGPNGAGKSTLLKIICGWDASDSGEVRLRPSATLGVLEQHPKFPPNATVWSHAAEALAHVERWTRDAEAIAEQMGQGADSDALEELGRRYDALQHKIEQSGGYAWRHRVDRVLDGLQFTTAQREQLAEELSGGQRNRLVLARLLLETPDVLILDEPSNHLDMESTAWLESYLIENAPTLLVVSHDRQFLDRVSTTTLELVHGTIDAYPGASYSKYVEQKQLRLETQRRTYERQQAEIARLEDFVRRNMVGQKHAQAEDRRKKLERIERVELPRETPLPVMGLPEPERSGDIVLRVERLGKSYDRSLFQRLTFNIERGEKWGVIGPNGCGKTTLLKCLLGEVQPDEGGVRWGAKVKIAYFDQMLSSLSHDQIVLEAVRPDEASWPEQQRRDLLARFGVTGDMVFQKVDSLSGGEKNRVALARLSATNANLLVLDEPTNHLDLWSREALERTLRSFAGTLLFVSHDRYFVRQVADRLLVAEDGGFQVFASGYSDYLASKEQPAPEVERAAKPATVKSEKSSGASPATSGKRWKYPFRKIADLEQDIASAEAGLEVLHSQLADPDVLRDGQRARQLSADVAAMETRLAELMEHWEEAHQRSGA